MNLFLVGAILFCASPLTLMLWGLGVSSTICLALSVGMAFTGFGVFMYLAFSFRRSFLNFERKLEQYRADHEVFMNTIKDLPPEEKIDRLLQKEDDEMKKW